MSFSHRMNSGSYRAWWNDWDIVEVAFSKTHVTFGLSVELPSDWHETQHGTLSIGLLWLHIYLMFPWYTRYEDHYQCSGPKIGFQFFSDLLWIFHGNSTGKSGDRSTTTIHMPWHWRFTAHEVLNAKGEWEPAKRAYMGEIDGRVTETHDYRYTMKSGDVQHRTAEIYIERRKWWRTWYPWKLTRQCIAVDFSDEVGERTGSWKGGTLGCGYDMLPGETAYQCLRRMEAEREF